MFFGPTVLQLSQQENVLVRAVSLSNGNFDGLGSIREKEFVESCRALGIERDHAVVLDNGKMQDGMNVWWKEEDVAEVVRKIVETHPIDTIITFDKYGISGHPNHRALYTGVKHLLLQTHKIPRNLKAYSLVSVPLLRKFISLLDLFPTFLMHFRHTIRNRKVLLEAENMEQVRTLLKSNLRKDRILFLSSPADVWQARKAMTCHKSQMVWFRHLYLIFSRYMVMNELEEI
ncbi:putative deacetylase LmbE-like domain-containing protein [Obelidium mucronatum]|nr:putative deacetylase LmbE-like domain-containing protein [Obelidium mucronatum]